MKGKSITIKDIPSELHATLRKRAKSKGRSLNREIIALLTAIAGAHRFDPQDFLQETRKLRNTLPGNLDDKLLNGSCGRQRLC